MTGNWYLNVLLLALIGSCWSQSKTTVSDPCSKLTCSNGGTCVRRWESYATCVCRSGYTGTYCQYWMSTTTPSTPTKYPNYCASIRCQNGGTCYNSDSGYGYCVCQPMAAGKYCEYYYTSANYVETTTVASFYKSTPRYDPCASNPCLNGGTCKASLYSSNYYCACPSYAKGLRCQFSSVQEPPCKLRYIDFKWDDLEKFENVTETMCRQYCSADSRCQYWTYHQYWNVCWTKSSTNQNSALPGRIENNWAVVSGFKTCPGDCEFRDTDFPGNDLDIMGVPVDYSYYSYPGSDECQRLCAETAECQFWSVSYVSGTQRCFRKRSATGLPSRVTDKLGTYSGFKSCPNGFHSLSQNDGYGPRFGK